MAEPVTLTVNDLKVKIADLLMEVGIRAEREDVMQAEIDALKRELATLTGGAVNV